MIPGDLPVTFQQGDTSSIALNWTEQGITPTTPGAQINLTGYSGVMQFRAVVGGPVLFSVSTAAPSANGSTLVLGGALFNIIGTFAAADTANMVSGVWNCTLSSGGGNVSTVVAGAFTILPLGE